MNAIDAREPHARQKGQSCALSSMIGTSPPMLRLKQQIARMAPTDAAVLITGETGTGKELVARALHELSPRASSPFVAVNCPAMPSELFQAEVFGHEKGAFTGATAAHAGRIEAACGGTLFLDEVGDLPVPMEAVLLRFLQEGTFERLGSVKPIRADVRIVAATHIDLLKAVKQQRFREDLYYRLCALQLRVPPLRERDDDKILLARYFLDECKTLDHLQATCVPHRLAAEAEQNILQYDWPGNVRELRNCILQAVVLADGPEITCKDLRLPRTGKDADREDQAIVTLQAARQSAERNTLQSALRACHGNTESAAQRLGISRAHLYRLIHRHRLEL
ncbi:MAG: sigma-54 dependent transcriptional regulator [Wenzhouxiangellaceae bacterium]|nr:sigma-54 dependent transcriptional regulator [Wenzhouxiangellaceae bacterium]